MVSDIIPFTKYTDDRPPTGAPISYNKSSIDYLLGHPPTESELDFVSDDADDGMYNSPSLAYKIPSLSQPSPPNTSQ